MWRFEEETLPIISDIWSPAEGTVWGGGVALLEEVHHWGRALRAYSRLPRPVHSLRILNVKNVIWPLPAAAASYHASPTTVDSLSRAVSQGNSSIGSSWSRYSIVATGRWLTHQIISPRLPRCSDTQKPVNTTHCLKEQRKSRPKQQNI